MSSISREVIVDASNRVEELAGRLRTLTVAVWSLAVLNALTVAGLVIGLAVLPMLKPSPVHLTTTITPVDSWEDKSFEERAKRATLVLITEFRSEAGTLRAYIKEELKRAPGTAFDFRIGDEYPPLARTMEANVSYGEGALVLLAGSPAEFRQSMSIRDGNVYVAAGQRGAPATLPLSEARRVVLESK
jgi:hypothetical protein